VAAATAAAILGSHPAHAEPTSADRARATSLFNEGRALLAQHRTSEACAKFDESEALDPGGGTLMNLARCREEEGRLATAWSEFAEARSMAVRDGRDDRRSEAEQQVHDLEPRLSKLTIEVDSSVLAPGFAVSLDGSPVRASSWSAPFAVDGGEHVVAATAPGKRAFHLTIHVEAERDRPRVAIPKLEDDPSSNAAEPPRPLGVQGAMGIGVSALGVVELGVGTYFGVHAIQRHHDSNAGCYKSQCSPTAVGLEVEAAHAADASTALVTLAVASAALGVTLIVTRPHAHRSLAVTAGLSRLSLAGRF